MTADLLSLLNNPDCPNELIRDKLLDEGLDVAAVHVVVGECGEYSDHTYWYVAAFLDPAAAQALAKRLNAWCWGRGCLEPRTAREAGFYTADVPLLPRADFPPEGERPPEDPQFRCDYTGTSYGVAEIPLQG